MQLASYLISICLHLGLFLLVVFWPAPPPVRLDSPPVVISLVDGAPGGNMTQSPILGHAGEPGDDPKELGAPAEKSEIAAPAQDEIRKPAPVETPSEETLPVKPQPVMEPAKPLPPKEEATPVKKPEPKKEEPKKPEPKREEPKKAAPVKQEPKKPEPKKEEPKKPEPKREEPKKPAPKTEDKKKPEPKKPEPKKPEPKKTAPKKPPKDPIAAALEQARKKASSRVESGDRGNAVEQALAQARKKASGNRGGGGGEGTGPGGGGINNVYLGQVMMAVRPNWGFASPARVNLKCVVAVKTDMNGKVLSAELVQSSGNRQFDVSAVNAVMRTDNAGQFPPPPNQDLTELDLVFSMDELTVRQ